MEGSDGERPSTHGLIKDKDTGCCVQGQLQGESGMVAERQHGFQADRGGLLYRTRIADGAPQFALNEVFNSGGTQADNVLRQGSFHMVGASAAWTDPAGRFTVRAFVDNLLNEAVRRYAVISNKPAGTYLPPRTYGGSINARF